MNLLYIRTAKTASSTVNDWCGPNLSVTFNQRFLDHEPNEKNIKIGLDRKDYLFTTVRNPFTRALSQWQQSLRKNWLKKDTSFDDFLEWDFRSAKSEHIDTHICSLTEYLAPILCKINKIIKIENLQKELTDLEEKFKLEKRRIGYFNKSSFKINYKEFYTPERVKKLMSRYEEDFDTFQYSKNVVDI